MCIEPLESRIAPAVTIAHPLPDLLAGLGKTGTTIDLGNLIDAAGSYHTFVTIRTNWDSDTNTAGVQGDIVIELFDDTAPLTVQNFLAIAQSKNSKGDYDGTFFERLAANFVLQGGNFNTNFKSGTATVPVTNEFGGSNLAGTVAMAKMPGDVNSATRAFFFNLHDNPGLDTQNGGFTVFGKVTAGSMGVLNGIAGLTTKDLAPGYNTPFGTVPVQGGYNADPDNNPATLPPLPTPAQLIQITDVLVDAPLHGSAPGITYTVNVTDANGGVTDLVSKTLDGDLLNLVYKKGASGVAKVTVTATDGVDSASDNFLVTIKPNLLATATNPFAGIVVPGDSSKVSVKLVNNGPVAAVGTAEIKVYLSPVVAGTSNPTPADDDILIGTMSNVAFNLASGASKSFSPTGLVPEALSLSQGTGYLIKAIVTPTSNGFSEITTNDNNDLDSTVHTLFNAFGTFSTSTGLRTNVPLTYVDGAGHRVTMSMTGNGFGQFFQSAANAPIDLELNGVSSKTAVSAKVSTGHTTLHQIAVSQPTADEAPRYSIGSINFGSVDLTGDFFAGGGIKTLTLGDLKPAAGDTASHTVQLGYFSETPDQKASVVLGNVTDYNFEGNQAVTSLKVASWKDVNATVEDIRSLYMASFAATGDFQADFTTLTSAKLKSFTVGGAVTGAGIQLGGSVGTVSFGSIANSTFLVSSVIVPTSGADFSSFSTIGSLTVKGALGTGAKIAAVSMTKVKIGSVDATGSTGTFGIYADQIISYQRGAVKLKNLLAASTQDVQGNYKVTVL